MGRIEPVGIGCPAQPAKYDWLCIQVSCARMIDEIFSGISTAIILGMSRAVGETMTVLMVCGGAAVIPHSFFQPVRPMTATIAAEMGEAVMGSTHYHALFAIGLILFLLTLLFNIVAELISRRFRIQLGLGR